MVDEKYPKRVFFNDHLIIFIVKHQKKLHRSVFARHVRAS